MQGLVDWQQVHSCWFFCRVCMIRMSDDSSAHEHEHEHEHEHGYWVC